MTETGIQRQAAPAARNGYAHVIHTNRSSTKSARRGAVTLACSLNARLRILLSAIMPFPLTLDRALTAGGPRDSGHLKGEGVCLILYTS